MSERHKPHNGRDMDGAYRVRRVDVDDAQSDPMGEDYIRDDVRSAGAVEDVGPDAGRRAAEIADRIRENQEDVRKMSERSAQPGRFA
jgi:hypothetical protein